MTDSQLSRADLMARIETSLVYDIHKKTKEEKEQIYLDNLEKWERYEEEYVKENSND